MQFVYSFFYFFPMLMVGLMAVFLLFTAYVIHRDVSAAAAGQARSGGIEGGAGGNQALGM